MTRSDSFCDALDLLRPALLSAPHCCVGGQLAAVSFEDL